MLVLNRKFGMWTDFYNKKTGDVVRVKVYDPTASGFSMVIDDEQFNYKVERPERLAKLAQKAILNQQRV